MAECGRIPITCPDCHQTFAVPVTLPIDGQVQIIAAAFEDEFTEHVMADPEAHPSFVIRTDQSAEEPSHG